MNALTRLRHGPQLRTDTHCSVQTSREIRNWHTAFDRGTIGLSVMATQASTITYLSLPGQATENGIAFIQNYFGLPLALIVVCAVFLPIYRKLGGRIVYAIDDLDAWAELGTKRSTSDPGMGIVHPAKRMDGYTPPVRR